MRFACKTCGAISDQRKCPRHRGTAAGKGTGTRNPDRDMAAHKRFARAVKKRDGYQCRRCGATHHLVAHHTNGLTSDEGITLCERCHRDIDPHAR